MRTVGIGTTVAAGLLLLLGIAIGVASAADIKRYFAMRRM